MAEYKSQHYLPQFYLRRFKIDDEESIKRSFEEIYRFDKRKYEIKRKAIKNSAIKSYYYSYYDNKGQLNPKIEKSFSDLENKANSTLILIDEKIDLYKRRQEFTPIDDEYRFILIFFLYVTMIRVPKIFDDIVRLFQKSCLLRY